LLILLIDLTSYNINIVYRDRADLIANYMLHKARNNEFHTLDYYLWYPFPMVSKFHGYNVTSYHYWDDKEFDMIYNEKYKNY